MAMGHATQETKATFSVELARDVVVLAVGLVVAGTLALASFWAVEPGSLLAGWNARVAMWSLVPAASLLVAHWRVAKAWTGGPGEGARAGVIDSRATTLAALMLAPAVLVLSAAVVAAVVGILGGPTHPNHLADDLTTAEHVVRASVGVGISLVAALVARSAAKHR